MRAIVFLLLIILVFLIIRFGLQKINQIRAQQNKERQQADIESQEMVKCAATGVHLPKSEAIQKGELFFCSEEHLKEYLEKHPD